MLGSRGPLVSQHIFGVATRGLRRGMVWCRDMTLGVAKAMLQWKTEVYRDRVFFVTTGFGCLMSQHSLGVATGPGLWAV